MSRVSERPRVLLFGPPLSAISGVTTHLNVLLASPLAQRYDLEHFEIGSRGRTNPSTEEGRIKMVLRLLLSPFELVIRILARRPNIIHLNTSFDKAFWRDFFYYLIARAMLCRVVYQIHGCTLERVTGGYRFARLIVQKTLASSDVVVVLASVEKADLEQQLGLRNVHVVANALNTDLYRCERSCLPRGRLRLRFLGRLVRDKGVFEAVDAIGLLASSIDVQLDIAGSGPASDELERHIQENRLSDRVSLVGPVYDDKKYEFLKNGDALLLPSYHEGLPYTVLEALAAGLPVIATNVGGIPDAVIEGENGFIVSPGSAEEVAEAITRLASHPERLIEMSDKCVARAREHYGLARITDQFDEIYSTILGK